MLVVFVSDGGIAIDTPQFPEACLVGRLDGIECRKLGLLAGHGFVGGFVYVYFHASGRTPAAARFGDSSPCLCISSNDHRCQAQNWLCRSPGFRICSCLTSLPIRAQRGAPTNPSPPPSPVFSEGGWCVFQRSHQVAAVNRLAREQSDTGLLTAGARAWLKHARGVIFFT